jgi:Flp pilus assembly protein TadG
MNRKNAMSFSRRSKFRRNQFSQGQSAVEFALLSTFALGLMLLGVQFALVGQAAIAVSHGASSLARYVANHPGALGTNNGSLTASSLTAAEKNLLSSSILTNGGNDLTINVNSYTGTGATQSGTPVAASDKVVIALSYVTTSKIAVPNPFLQIPGVFAGISFPSTVGSSSSQMYE